MALASGTRLGAYEIQSLIGSGGMGEVYRARDQKLDRDVAIKVLPTELATDPERLARFEREAKTLASLNHQNIAHIHGIEDSTGVPALVMELVDGPTVADRIAKGPIPLDEALPITKQIAEALEAAHEQGIIHRDLKPANIKVRLDGTVKLLDFGLAKAFDPIAPVAGNATMSPTLSIHGTQAGIILGTAAYMAPEQVRGATVDKRADIWAFGVVLYEMIVGRRLFEGDTISDTLAGVLREPIDFAALPTTVPEWLRGLLRRCLERDARQRLRDIGEARVMLADPPTSAQPSTVVVRRTGWPTRVGFALAAFSLGAALAGFAASRLKSVPLQPVSRFTIPLGDGQSFANVNRHAIAISPDGSLIAYIAAGKGLFLRSMSDLAIQPIRGSESSSVMELAFSPDGKSIVFYAASDGTLKRISVAGGAPMTLCQTNPPSGIAWDSDFVFFGAGARGIMRVAVGGGTPETIARVNQGEIAQGPQVLPDGEHVVFAIAMGTERGNWDRARIVVQSLRTGDRHTLIEGGSDPRVTPTGHLLYALSGIVFAVPFDVGTLRVTGSPVAVLEGVRRTTVGGDTGTADFAFSTTGSLVYIPGPASISATLPSVGFIDRRGNIEPLKLSPGPYRWPRISPDGKRVAVNTDTGKEATIWTYDVSGTTAIRRVTFGGNNRFPVWTTDSKRLTFQSDRENDRAIFWQDADGSGTVERLTTANRDEAHIPDSWSPRNDTLLFTVVKGSDSALWVLSMPDKKTRPFEGAHSRYPLNATFSPDGRWVAYASGDGTRTTVYVQPFPPTGPRYELFAAVPDNPHHPLWSPNGKELFFDPRAGGLEVVAVTTEPVFAFGNPTEVPRSFISSGADSRRAFDMAPNGHFVALVEGRDAVGVASDTRMNVVVNWLQELRSRACEVTDDDGFRYSDRPL